MSSHLGICETCGFSTSIEQHSFRKCPKGHGSLLFVNHRYSKLINKKNSTGEDRLRRLRLLQKQRRVQNELSQLGKIKLIGTGRAWNTIYHFLHPHREKIR